MKEAIEVILTIICICLAFSIRACQCDWKSGSGISSHYNPFIGCVYEIEGQ